MSLIGSGIITNPAQAETIIKLGVQADIGSNTADNLSGATGARNIFSTTGSFDARVKFQFGVEWNNNPLKPSFGEQTKAQQDAAILTYCIDQLKLQSGTGITETNAVMCSTVLPALQGFNTLTNPVIILTPEQVFANLTKAQNLQRQPAVPIVPKSPALSPVLTAPKSPTSLVTEEK